MSLVLTEQRSVYSGVEVRFFTEKAVMLSRMNAECTIHSVTGCFRKCNCIERMFLVLDQSERNVNRPSLPREDFISFETSVFFI